ncbi:MAG: hypothetical protein JRI25_17260 [Deltaproteobacteria bacterium]|nr:hypothetical protein [Deltaproteobacteria bacterium]
MTESPESPETAPKSGKWWKLRIGCLILAVLAVATPAAMWQWSSDWAEKREQRASDRHARHANDAFEPVIDALEEGAAANPEATYDIDKTIRVIHQIDLALQQEGSLDEYLKAVAVQDYRDVAPKVLEARRDLMDVLLRLYAKQVEAEDQQAMWEFTSELLLSTLSVVEVSGDLNLTSPEGGFSIDRAQAQELLTELKDDKAERRQLVRDISALEKELIESLFEYSDVYYTYVQEWDQLSVLRDRAYLAVWNGDWEEAIVSAELAIEQAPHEREAHLIKAMALIEQDDMERDEEIGRLLSDYIEDHPESSAPAFLLLGVHHTRRGQTKAARLAFQQSAAYFPKQSDELTDMLDPYKMRSFLRKSREGSFIVELYKSTMLGAGYFSPDLQMARVLFEQGDDEAARTKVLDHFARRRQQQQWDFILSDVRFCHDLLGPDFWEIFPEDTYIDLVVSPTTFGSGLKLAINNRSTRTLHNATLVLALHFTDSYPGDYEAMTAPETMPAVSTAGRRRWTTSSPTARSWSPTRRSPGWTPTSSRSRSPRNFASGAAPPGSATRRSATPSPSATRSSTRRCTTSSMGSPTARRWRSSRVWAATTCWWSCPANWPSSARCSACGAATSSTAPATTSSRATRSCSGSRTWRTSTTPTSPKRTWSCSWPAPSATWCSPGRPVGTSPGGSRA